MDIKDKIITIIKENIEDGYDLTEETNLRESLSLDSFATLMIIAALEDEFSIYIEASDFESVRTVSDIINLLKEKYLHE